MLHQLEPILSQRNRLGYVAARNYRTLSNALIEYDKFKMELVEKYGEPDKAEDGTELPTVTLQIGSPNFKAFCDEMAPYNNIEQELDIMTVPFDDVIGVLSGQEIVSIDWMLVDPQEEEVS
jgi:hypothetical protein